MEKIKVKFKRVADNAVAPAKAHATDAGFDLCVSSITYEDGNIVLHSGIAIELPAGSVARLYARSSIAHKGFYLTNGVGVIDEGYRGEVMAKMKACPTGIVDDFQVGEKFAQLIVEWLPKVEFVEVDELSSSERGTGGFGSTGE